MLLRALLLHLAIHLLSAARHALPTKTTAVRPIDRHYVIKHVDCCPDVGYYFERETRPNSLVPGPCYLCFCHGENSALCWKRENKRCDVESFHYHGVGKRGTRVRRSPDPAPFGLGDVFFRDAARNYFNKQPQQECKPHESSFSEGCPPADWCVGCTVCDCNSNGHWDCHILSFCPDKKTGAKPKKRIQRVAPKQNISPTKPTKRIITSTTKKTFPKKPNVAPRNMRRMVNNANKKPQADKRVVKKSVPKRVTKKPHVKPPTKHWKPAVTKKWIAPKTPRPKFINRYVSTHKPVKIKRSPMSQILLNNSNNATVKAAQQIVSRVMAAVKKMVGNQMQNLTKYIYATNQKPPMKKVNKRQIKKAHSLKKKGPLKKYLIRNKRDILEVQKAKDSNFTIQEEKPLFFNASNTTERPISTKSIQLIADNVTTINPSNQSEYYKYVMESQIGTTDRSILSSSIYNTETVLNLITTEKIRNFTLELSKIDKKPSDTLLDNLYVANDIKFNDWLYLKNMKERHLKNRTEWAYDIDGIIKNDTNLNTQTRVNSKDIERKLWTKKYNVVKVVSPKMNLEDMNKNRSLVQQKIKNNINDLHKSVQKLFTNFYRNSHGTLSNKKRKFKKFNLVKYVKKFFNKIFKPKSCNREEQAIKSLCETFGPCQLNKNEKHILVTNLKNLNGEAKSILNSIKIVKGLLHLINIPINSISTINSKPSLGNDLQKLDNILKGTYHTNDSYKLSNLELTQIDYVKKNTQDFIQSVNKFATILNEIVAVITNNKKRHFGKLDRILKNVNNKEISNNDPIKSIKNLIMKYNIVHNNFIKKIYKALNDFENKIMDKRDIKVSDDANKNLNNTLAIELFSRNIINNLRHLKGVAQTMTFNSRNKREIGKDRKENESVEYLLMLMEYLMKQSHPLDDAPVNDGIDLLIEAIKNAPDIKPIKKKVLVVTSASVDHFATHTVTPLNFNKTINSNGVKSYANSYSKNQVEPKYPTKDDTFRVNDGISKDSEQEVDNAREKGEKHNFDRKHDMMTESGYFRKIEESINTDLVYTLETTTEVIRTFNDVKGPMLDYDSSDKMESTRRGNIDKTNEDDENKNDKNEINEEDSENKVEIDGTVSEEKTVTSEKTKEDKKSMEEDLESSFYNDMVPQVKNMPSTKSIHTTEPYNGIEVTETVLKKYDSNKHKGSESKHNLQDTKSPIDWIEENFGIDPKTVTPLKVLKVPSTTESAVAKTEKREIAISGMTKEMMDEEDNKKKKEINTEDIIYRKQMDLLNSLDYGTEKSELEDADSKERSAGDSFPSYF